jgi:hypothetical protein
MAQEYLAVGDYLEITTPVVTNYLLNSQNMSGSGNTDYNITTTPNYSSLDPTGGSNHRTILSELASGYAPEFTVSNIDPLAWVSISGSVGATNDVSLKNDFYSFKTVNFTGSKSFVFGIRVNPTPQGYLPWTSVQFDNYGLVYFGTDNDLPQRDRSSPKDLPIDTTLQLIAVYWKKMFASVGEIWHKQEADRFIIEYVGVNALNGSFPQSYQVLLYFDTGKIEMKFLNVSGSGVFRPNPNIGIQWARDRYHNYSLSNLDATKSLIFERSQSSLLEGSWIMADKVTPNAERTFSVYLKRYDGSDPIRYTLDGGLSWNLISPPLDYEWTRYTFPSNIDSQQVGIQIDTRNDAIQIYGAQLES